MNPAVITAVGSLVGRFFDKTKPIGMTNLATAGGSGIIYLGYTLLEGGEEPVKWVGVALMAVGAAVTLIKEYKK
jgi:hypothetical protein